MSVRRERSDDMKEKDYDVLNNKYQNNEVWEDLLDISLFLSGIFDLLAMGDYIILSKKEYEKLKNE